MADTGAPIVAPAKKRPAAMTPPAVLPASASALLPPGFSAETVNWPDAVMRAPAATPAVMEALGAMSARTTTPVTPPMLKLLTSAVAFAVLWPLAETVKAPEVVVPPSN